MSQRRTRITAPRTLGLLACSLLAGCGEEVPTPPSNERPHAHWKRARTRDLAPTQDDALREEIEALQAIGYAAGVNAAGELHGVVLHDIARSQPGFNLYTSGHAPEALLIDARGRLVHRWSKRFDEVWPERSIRDDNANAKFWRRVALDAEGNLFAIFEGLGLVKLDLRSRVIWENATSVHHDLELQDDGTLLVLTRRAHVIPRLDPERPVLEDFVTLLDARGEELWSVSLLEAFERSEYAAMFEQRRRKFQEKQDAAGLGPQRQPWGDIFHTNTVERLHGEPDEHPPTFVEGNVLVSLRNVHLIAVLDPRAGRIVWARGGHWRDQHQPSLLDSGHVLLFNNRAGDRRSEVVEIDPTSGERLWSWSEPEPEAFFSAASGSCERLPNGHTLVTESNAGRAFELTPEGEVVWDFRSPHHAGDEDQWVANLFELIRLPHDDPRLTWFREGHGARDDR